MRRPPREGPPTSRPEAHRPLLESLGLSGPPLEGLTCYLDALEGWSRRVNLTGARTPGDRVRRLVEPVLALQGVPEPGTLMDVGSGNGSPGLVLALLRDDLEVTLLEPRNRRWAFLREAVRRTGLSRVDVLRCRHGDYGGDPARTVTLRALALPLPELAPLVAPGGRLLVMGERPRLEGPFADEPAPQEARGAWLFRRLPADVPRETSDGH